MTPEPPPTLFDAPDHVARIQQQWRLTLPDLDVSPVGIIGRLHRLAGHLTRDMVATYDRFGLSEGEFDVLATLRRFDAPLQPGRLAEHTMVTTGAMSKRLDRLEADGWVVRGLDAQDGRARSVELTSAGRDLMDRAYAAHMADEHRLLEPLADADRAAAERILTRWLAAFE